MGIFRDEVSRQFIAVPDDRKDQIVVKWPDINIRKGARAIVNADEQALFINKGQVVGTLGPGQHVLDADEIMFLGLIIDWATDGNAYRAEIYFAGTREYPGQTFGGRIDEVQDPQTGLVVTLRVWGDYSMQVLDPGKLVTNLTGTVDVENNEAITYWMSNQLLKVFRTEVTRQITRNGWPILGLAAYTPEIEAAVQAAANLELRAYGIEIARMGNVNINLDDEDEETLKGLASDTAYSRLAGSYGQFAAGEALRGAGEGMAQGGGAGVQGAFLATGLGVAGQMGSAPVGPTPPPGPGFVGGGAGFAAPAGGPTCASCGAANPAGARFCASCGTAMAAAAHCTGCGAELPTGARFCPGCGTTVEATAGAGGADEAAGGDPADGGAGTPPPPT